MAAVRDAESAQPTLAPTNDSLKSAGDKLNDTILETDPLKGDNEDQVLFSCNICYEVINVKSLWLIGQCSYCCCTRKEGMMFILLNSHQKLIRQCAAGFRTCSNSVWTSILLAMLV